VSAGLTVRRAGPEDEERLLAWRNDPAARRASFQGEEISPETHHAWLARKLADPDCAMLVFEEDSEPVAHVRLDRHDPGLAEVSVTVAPTAQGRGIGRLALELAAERAQGLLGVSTLLARIKEDNEVSTRAFLAVGFKEVARGEGEIELRRGLR
jgi:UDP-2,4-diacetamido-2,4,6-trideoxy-beta-L-altropyranose hydrolase